MREVISVGPPPSRRAIVVLCVAVLVAQLIAIPLTLFPWYFLVSTLVSPVFLPIWIVSAGLILLCHWSAALLATLAVRRISRDARSLSGWHVARSATLGLLGGVGLGALVLVCDQLIGHPTRVAGFNPHDVYRETTVACLVGLALTTGLVLGTIRGTRHQGAL